MTTAINSPQPLIRLLEMLKYRNGDYKRPESIFLHWQNYVFVAKDWKQLLWSILVASKILTSSCLSYSHFYNSQANCKKQHFFTISFLNSVCLNIQYLLEASGLVVWNSSWGLSHGSEEGEERIWYLCQCLMTKTREPSPNYTGFLWFPLCQNKQNLILCSLLRQ